MQEGKGRGRERVEIKERGGEQGKKEMGMN